MATKSNNMLKKVVNMRDSMPRYAAPKGRPMKMPKKQGVADDEATEKKYGVKDNETAEKKKLKPIKIAPGHVGDLHRNLKVPLGQKIPLSKLKAAANSKNPKIRKRANFALNFRNK